MASSFFLKLALKCIHHFAWPLIALGYPLCASVQAIETDSYKETRDLVSYWILLSLIYLFEYAFLSLLQLFQFWPYIKLMIIFWLVVPDFGRASNVYSNIRTCITIKLQVVIYRLKIMQKFFVKKENFLQHAERYINENGTEALENLISSKNTLCQPDAKVTSTIKATYNEEMEETNGKRLQTEQKGIKDLVVTIKATDNKEMRETNGTRLQSEIKNIRELEVVGKKEIPAGNQDIAAVPNLILPSQNVSSAMSMADTTTAPNLTPPSQKILSVMAETNGLAREDTANGELPQAPSCTLKEVQREWTCALCQITTSSEITLNSHLRGRKHKALFEALRKKNHPNSKTKCGDSMVNHGLKGKVNVDHKEVQNQQNKLSGPVKVNYSKLRCEVCNVKCTSEVDFASHLIGKRHLANIQTYLANIQT